jgi:hypothetical protein
MKITREWAMPSKHTFTIKPIKLLIERYVGDGDGWIDPFAGDNSPAEMTNDLNPKKKAGCNMHALEFVKMVSGEFNGILFDPPYSPRQVKECYNSFGVSAWKKDTQGFSAVKRAAATRIVPGGYAISFGWNSNGFGKKLGFEAIEMLVVAHGGNHNDTICLVERKGIDT